MPSRHRRGTRPPIGTRTRPDGRAEPRQAALGGDALDLEIGCGPRAPRRARETLVAWLGAADERLAADARLLLSELVANAVLHGEGGVVHVTARRADGVVRVAVTSAGSRRPERRRAAVDALSGRGLDIVAGVANRWGTHHHDQSVTVWFELA